MPSKHYQRTPFLRKISFWLVMAVCIGCAALNVVSVTAEQNDVNDRDPHYPATLSAEERAFLKAHPVVRVHNEKDWPPFNYFEYGTPRGLSIDYMNQVAEKLGIKVEYITGPSWNEFLDMAKRKELDVMLNIVKTDDRMKYLLYTEPYIRNPNTIVSLQKNPYDTIQALFGKTVAFPEGFFYEEVLTKSFPRIKRLPVEDTLASFKAVMFGRADAALAEAAVAQTMISKNLLTGLRISGEVDIGNPDLVNLRIGVRDDWPLLRSALMKAMAALSPEHMNRIRQKWLMAEKKQIPEQPVSSTAVETIPLTTAEKNWLAEHKTVRFTGDPDWLPQEAFTSNGQYIGIVADILDLLEVRLGIKFERVPVKTWAEAVRLAETSGIDVLSETTSSERDTLTFTESYLGFPVVIIAKHGTEPISDPGALKGKRVAVVEGYGYVVPFRRQFPDLDYVEVETVRDGLMRLSAGEIHAFISAAPTAFHLMSELGLTNLDVIGSTGLSIDLGFGVRKDKPLLVSILNKALASITQGEKFKIRQKWVPVIDTPAPPKTVSISYGRLVAYGSVVFLILSLLTWVLIKTIKKEQIAVQFGSRWFRGFVLAGLSVFILIVVFLGWYMLERNKTEALGNVDTNLRSILSVSQDRFDLWLKERISFIARLGRDPRLVSITKQLLQVEPNQKALLASKALQEARLFFKNAEDIFPNIGFFVINPDHVSIGSMRDANIGTRNLISEQHPERLRRALQGEVGFVPPIISDVALGKTSESRGIKKPPTMFFIGPVQDSDGKILGAMTLRVDPWTDFARAMKSYGGGASRESYAFDRNGVMLSTSRFEDQLRRIGLLAEDQTSALNIEIRDPGGNMVKGYRPAITRSHQPLTRMVSNALNLRQQMELSGAGQSLAAIESSMEEYRDYRGVPVYGAWLWNTKLDIGMAVEVNADEALTYYYRTRATIFTILGFTLILSVGAILFVLIIGERTSRALMRARDELELRVQERTADLRKLSRATENSPASVVVTNTNGTIEYVNPTFCQVTGYSSDEAIGQNPSVLKSGSLPESHYKELWDTIRAGNVWRGEFINKRKNGEDFWESASISPIMNEEGEITHFVAVKQDITERKHMEQEILAAMERAEEATRAKSDFLANMSHEIRTPMNAVIGMSHLALKTELTPKQKDYLDKIQSSAKSLLGIINDILDFSKIEAGKLDMEFTEFNLDKVLDNVANLVTVKAQEKEEIEVLFATAQEVPRFLVGDPLRLGQVLINLSNNAVKFTESGEIVVSTELFKRDENGLTIKFSVSDTGIGLTENQMDKLFQSFSQADTSTTRKFGGTGLGLTISKRLVAMMGGEIWVDSEPGRGTTFSFTANFGLGTEAVISPLVPSPDLRGLKVLVVDDNATSRKIFQDMLQSFSFEVHLAASGEEGLEDIETHDRDKPFELVIMDWKMPNMDGIEASRRIKTSKTLSKIPAIVLVTAYSREELMQQADEIGLGGFLLKPVSPSTLFDTTMQALGRAIKDIPHAARKKEQVAESLTTISGIQVLLVEDNEINQQVAKEILEGAGLVVTIANDGQEAVNAFKDGDFDVILMDIQMPVMDGYTATRKIRECESASAKAMADKDGDQEKGNAESSIIRGNDFGDSSGTSNRHPAPSDQKPASSIQDPASSIQDPASSIQYPAASGQNPASSIQKPIPIIAMTAHAMAGDEQKSIEAGMNGHVTKPIDPNQLFTALQKLVHPGEKRGQIMQTQVPAETPASVSAQPAEDELPESLPGFDLADGLRRLQQNKRLYRKLLLSFAKDYNAAAKEIRQALDAEDFESTHSLVHNLKGLAGNLSATGLQAAAIGLETLVKNVDKKPPSLEQLNLKFSELENALNQALESAQSLGQLAKENADRHVAESAADIPTELSQDIAKRIRAAAEMGDVMKINAIADEIKDQSDSCMLLSKRIIQMAEDFDLDGIQKLADDLDEG